ncbi:hypothetical protein BKA82DRAFT_4341820 [Pisolithus tinctorius]|nr:hypothetical protein BKA82DRAFT_4341820 [Pisolithus tinctorius]
MRAAMEMAQRTAIHPIVELPCVDQVPVDALALWPMDVQVSVVPTQVLVQILYFRPGTFLPAHRGNMGVGGTVDQEENGTYMPRGRVQHFVAVVPESQGVWVNGGRRCGRAMADDDPEVGVADGNGFLRRDNSSRVKGGWESGSCIALKGVTGVTTGLRNCARVWGQVFDVPAASQGCASIPFHHSSIVVKAAAMFVRLNDGSKRPTGHKVGGGSSKSEN